MSKISFTKVTVAEFVNSEAESPMNTFHTAGDFDGDGKPDIVMCGRNGEMAWFRNPGDRSSLPWEKRAVDSITHMECGGCAFDITGNGFPDIINGSDYAFDGLYWWENPGKSGYPSEQPWNKHMIAKTGKGMFHDTLVADVTGDGKMTLLFTNQTGGTSVTAIPLPTDPEQSPWPGAMILADNLVEANPTNPWSNGVQPEEGLAVGDIDGDGVNEVVVGTHWFKYKDGAWEVHKFAKGYITTKCLITDIDGDGRMEVVLSEGDPCIYGRAEGGKLAWFKPGTDIAGLWEEHVIAEGLLDAHTLQAADLFGKGRQDLVVGEVGKNDGECGYADRLPVLAVYRNLGDGRFERQVIDEGTGIHEAILVDMDGDGMLDIVGKPLIGDERWMIHVYYNNGPVE